MYTEYRLDDNMVLWFCANGGVHCGIYKILADGSTESMSDMYVMDVLSRGKFNGV